MPEVRMELASLLEARISCYEHIIEGYESTSKRPVEKTKLTHRASVVINKNTSPFPIRKWGKGKRQQ